jgi:hypothetical protein
MFSGKIIRIWLILLTVVLAALLIASCTGSTKPDPDKNPINKAPKVEMVNIPPDNSHFTTNPQLFWFGTDVDGRVVAYEYAVVPCSLVAKTIDTSNAAAIIGYASTYLQSPTAGRDCRPESCWQVLDVASADNPNKQTIRLFADADPKISVVQYFFVRAVDNDSARSTIDFRLYSRTNHPPDTEIKTLPDTLGYYDVPETTLTYRGITFEWKGTDKIDYPNDNPEPTFEYRYQIFGPYQEGEIPYRPSDTLGHFELDPTRFDETDESKQVLQSLDTATNDVWVTANTTRIYNLWRKQPQSSTTRSAWFVLKVVSRDDAFVPDTTPAYLPFFVIYPRFENDLFVWVAPLGANSRQPGNLLLDTAIMHDPTLYDCRHDIIPYYKRVVEGAGYLNVPFRVNDLNPKEEFGESPIELPSRELLAQYKVFLVIDDGEKTHLSFQSSDKNSKKQDGLLNALAPYMDLGGNAWLWGLSTFAVYDTFQTIRLVPLANYRLANSYFGVLAYYRGGWGESYKRRASENKIRPYKPTNEEFIGGLALGASNMESFQIDTAKLQGTYLLNKADPPHSYEPCCVEYDADSNCLERNLADTCDYLPDPWNYLDFRAAPNTNYFVPDVFSERLWLFNSLFGGNVPDSLAGYVDGLQGKVIGIRYDSGVFKTAAFGFSLWMMKEEQASRIFRDQMTWFLQP